MWYNFVTVPSIKRYTDNVIQMSSANGPQRLVCCLGIIAQGSADQDFEEIHYFQSMRLYKEAFGAIVQTNVESITENLKNIGAVVSSKLIELWKSPSLARKNIKRRNWSHRSKKYWNSRPSKTSSNILHQQLESKLVKISNDHKVFERCVNNASCCLCSKRI